MLAGSATVNWPNELLWPSQLMSPACRSPACGLPSPGATWRPWPGAGPPRSCPPPAIRHQQHLHIGVLDRVTAGVDDAVQKSCFMVTKRMRAGMPASAAAPPPSGCSWCGSHPCPFQDSHGRRGGVVGDAAKGNAAHQAKQASALSRGVLLSWVRRLASRRILGWPNCTQGCVDQPAARIVALPACPELWVTWAGCDAPNPLSGLSVLCGGKNPATCRPLVGVLQGYAAATRWPKYPGLPESAHGRTWLHFCRESVPSHKLGLGMFAEAGHAVGQPEKAVIAAMSQMSSSSKPWRAAAQSRRH